MLNVKKVFYEVKITYPKKNSTGQKKRHQNLGMKKEAKIDTDTRYYCKLPPFRLNRVANGSNIPTAGVVVRNMIIKDSHSKNRIRCSAN